MKAKTGVLEFRKGEIIIREGDPGEVMFIIEEGEVEILKGAEPSPKRLGVLSHGDFFGEMSIIDDLPRGATARAFTDCRLLAIDHSTFDQMLRRFPEVAIRMLRRMSARMREAEAAADSTSQAAALGGSPPNAPAPDAPLPFEAPSQAHRLPPVTAPAGPEAAGTGTRWKLVLFDAGVDVDLPDRPEIRIGRFDTVTGTQPDVDLTGVDVHKTTSRRHARILREAERLFVLEEIGTANGTCVNGSRIGSGVRAEVKDGDWLQFGDVKTILKVG